MSGVGRMDKTLAIIGMILGIAGVIELSFFTEGTQGFSSVALGWLIGASLLFLLKDNTKKKRGKR